MPAKKKYFTEEEKLEALRRGERKYRASGKANANARRRYRNDEGGRRKKQREATKNWIRNLTPERKEALLSNRRQINTTWRRRNVNKSMYADARKRAKKKGIEFSLLIEDIHIPEQCPVLKIPLFQGDGGRIDNSPSLDRVDNDKGYTKDNIQVISQRANALKNNGSIWEFEQIIEYMKSHGVGRKEY